MATSAGLICPSKLKCSSRGNVGLGSPANAGLDSFLAVVDTVVSAASWPLPQPPSKAAATISAVQESSRLTTQTIRSKHAKGEPRRRNDGDGRRASGQGQGLHWRCLGGAGRSRADRGRQPDHRGGAGDDSGLLAG